MARSSCFHRCTQWFACLLCLVFLTGTATASTRKHVSMPSASSVANSSGGAVSRSGNDLSVAGELIGEYIPATGTGTKGTPIKVLPTLDYSIPRTINAAKNLLKNNLAQALLGTVIAGAVASVDWVMDPENNTLQRKITDGEVQPPTTWKLSASSTGCPGPFTQLKDWNTCYQNYHDAVDGRFIYTFTPVSFNSSTKVLTYNHKRVWKNGGAVIDNYNTTVPYVGSCAAPLFLTTAGVCINPEKATYAPIGDADFPALDPYLNGLGPNMIHDLLKQTCNGSTSPDGCFQEMKERSTLTGPATVPGPTTTTTSTSTNGSGVTSQTVTTKSTDYKIIYGDTFFDFSKKTTTNISVDGVPVASTEEEEGTDPVEETPPEEEEQAVLCSGDICNGPAYQDLYTPTTETKEDHIDDYMTRVSNIPILLAVTGLFDISVGGSCPTWNVSHAMPVMAASMDIDLTFDFFCLPWFIQYGPWIRAVIAVVATYAAIRIGLL